MTRGRRRIVVCRRRIVCGVISLVRIGFASPFRTASRANFQA